MGFDLRPTFLAAGAAFGTVATIAAAYADLPALVVIGGVAVVADVIGAGVTHNSMGVDADSNTSHVHPANDSGKGATSSPAQLKPGDRMADGTVYAGLSPETGEAMYTTPADAPLTTQWTAAMQYAAKLDAHGHQDWRVPTKNELNVLFNHRAAIGGFDETDSKLRSWYWSSTLNLLNLYPFGQRFGNGLQYTNSEDKDLSLRLVR